LGQLATRKETFTQNPVSIEQMGELIDMVQDGHITGAYPLTGYIETDSAAPGTSGKVLLRHMITQVSLEMPSKLAGDLSLAAFSETDSASDALRRLCEDAITALPEEASVVRKGNEKVIMKLVGRVMKDSRGRADAKGAGELLRELLLPKR
jgi:aspartyl-tRNA(Asn)/glutamyl-tRNA(Gln) amidotransferase subunit B